MGTLRQDDPDGQLPHAERDDHPLGVVRALLREFRRGDLAAAATHLADDVVTTVIGPGPLAGSYRGRDGWLRYAAALRGVGGGTFNAEELDAAAGRDHAVLVLRATIRGGSGGEVTWRRQATYRILENRIAELWLVDLDLATAERAYGTDGAVP